MQCANIIHYILYKRLIWPQRHQRQWKQEHLACVCTYKMCSQSASASKQAMIISCSSHRARERERENVPAGISANETLAIGHRGLGAQTMSLCCVCECAPSERTPYIYILHTFIRPLCAFAFAMAQAATDCENVIVHFATARIHITSQSAPAQGMLSFSECIKSNEHRHFFNKKCTRHEKMTIA